MNRPLKIITFYDVKGWAWWYRSHQIQKNLSSRFQLDIIPKTEKYDPLAYDLVMIFDFFMLSQTGFVVPPPDRLLVGCSNSRLMNDMITVVEQGPCLAGFVNNFHDYRKVIGKQNFFCCQNGVDTELYYPAVQPPKNFKACWVGSTNSMCNKGIDLVQQACAQTGTELITVAVNPRDNNLMSPEQLREYVYQQASVLVCASEFEGTPNPALEALACGLPVISTRVGNMPELIREGYNGILVDRTVDDIANALITIKAQDWSSLSRNSRNSVEDGWTWKQQTKKYEEMFLRLAQMRGL